MGPMMMGMCGKGGCAMGGGGHHLASVLMAATAVLGYWALRWSDKDPIPTRYAGRAVGWVLVVFGLGGFLCGSLSHGAKMAGMRSGCPMGGTASPDAPAK